MDSGPTTQQDGGGDRFPGSPFVTDWLFFHASQSPGAPAITSPTTRLTYGDVAHRVKALARHLGATRLEPGDRVLLALPNSPASIIARLALNTIGAVPLEVGADWTAEMVSELVHARDASQVFLPPRLARAVAPSLADAGLDRVWIVGDMRPSEASETAFGDAAVGVMHPDGHVDAPSVTPAPSAPPNLDPDQIAVVLFTSGSLGRPHGVMQTFANIDANTRSIVEYLGLQQSDRAMLTLPLSYCYGRSVLQSHLFVGGSVFLDHRMAFPRTVLETMRDEGCTGFAGVPLTFEVIRRQVDVSTIEFPHLRYLTQAGASMSAETTEWVRSAFDPAQLFVMYGQTEATARLSYLPPEKAPTKPGSIGIPIPGVELRVVDEHGRGLPPDTVGELIAGGANVTPGYLDEPDASASILRDGWLWTGDLAERDEEGFFYHRGRARDMLKVGGHRISPGEIEHALEQHPDVAEVVVIGAPDALLGEAPIAVVVPRPGVEFSESGLLRFCHQALSPPRVPKRVIITTSLPRNAAGKPLRTEIARLYGASRLVAPTRSPRAT